MTIPLRNNLQRYSQLDPNFKHDPSFVGHQQKYTRNFPFTDFVNWKVLKEAEIGTHYIVSPIIPNIRLELIREILIEQAVNHSIIITCDDLYPKNIFEKIYFSELEKSIGYNRSIKHFQLLRTIDIVLELKKVEEEEILIVKNKNVLPQIGSSPKAMIDRFRSLL